MNETIILIPYVKKNDAHFKIDLYSKTHGSYLTREEIKGYRDQGYKIEIDMNGRPVNKYKDKKSITETELLLRLLRSWEPSQGDSKFLTRIIRNGGFISYIQKLENSHAN